MEALTKEQGKNKDGAKKGNGREGEEAPVLTTKEGRRRMQILWQIHTVTEQETRDCWWKEHDVMSHVRVSPTAKRKGKGKTKDKKGNTEPARVL